MKVLLCFEEPPSNSQPFFNIDFIFGFFFEIQNLKVYHLLKDIAFDGDVWLNPMRDLFKIVNVTLNLWNSEGIRYKSVGPIVSVHDSPDSFKHAYDWTVDRKGVMRRCLREGVYALITNKPKNLAEVLEELEFKGRYRLATAEDDPFVIPTHSIEKASLWRLPEIREDQSTEDDITTNAPQTMEEVLEKTEFKGVGMTNGSSSVVANLNPHSIEKASFLRLPEIREDPSTEDGITTNVPQTMAKVLGSLESLEIVGNVFRMSEHDPVFEDKFINRWSGVLRRAQMGPH